MDRVSPDGRWIAFTTELAGQPEVWVQPYPDPEVGEVTPLTTSGGIDPQWSRGGSELYFLTPDRSAQMVVSIPGEADEEWALPEGLFELSYRPGGNSNFGFYATIVYPGFLATA